MGTASGLMNVEWGECIIEPVVVPPALAREIRRRFGAVPGWAPRLARVPWLVTHFAELGAKPMAYVPLALCDLISLVVSQDNSCRYCYGAQRALLRVAGYGEDAITRLERDYHVADLSAAEKAALDFARRVSRADPRPTRSDLEAVVRAGLDRRAVAEVVVAVARITFMNRVATLLALPPETGLEAMADLPAFRLLRPFVAWRMRARPRTPELLSQAADAPCAPIVAALGDSPAAGVVRRGIDGAMASDVLPRQTKLLLLAVIGRALGCTLVQAEAAGALGREGWDRQEVDEVLAHLASSRLDAREARLVPFARETVRYQTPAIQRRTREVCRGFTPEGLLETVGITALANALCRLSILADV